MANFSDVDPSISGTAQGSLDLVTPLFVLLPFIIFLLLVYWGMQKKDRKKRVIEASYNLIALQVLALLISPVCHDSFVCMAWAMVPVIMFAVLMYFSYHRKKKESESKKIIAKALADGHIHITGLLEGKLEQVQKEKNKKPPTQPRSMENISKKYGKESTSPTVPKKFIVEKIHAKTPSDSGDKTEEELKTPPGKSLDDSTMKIELTDKDEKRSQRRHRSIERTIEDVMTRERKKPTKHSEKIAKKFSR